MTEKVLFTFDLVQLLTDYLSIKDVMVFIRVNSFYHIHFNEPFWKRKIRRDYCINDKFRNRSWKEMARYFYKNKMVNLGKRWVNGMKYEEMISESKEMKNEYFNNRLDEAIIDAIDSKEISKHKRSFYPCIAYEECFERIMLDIIGREIKNSELISLKKIFTRELSIIFASCTKLLKNTSRHLLSPIIIRYFTEYLGVYIEFDGSPSILNRILLGEYNVISNDLPHVLFNLIVFSSFSNDELDEFIHIISS